jgi:hypothetical protein
MVIKAGDDEYRLEPLLDDQELDSRASTGTIYWEGAYACCGTIVKPDVVTSN